MSVLQIERVGGVAVLTMNRPQAAQRAGPGTARGLRRSRGRSARRPGRARRGARRRGRALLRRWRRQGHRRRRAGRARHLRRPRAHPQDPALVRRAGRPGEAGRSPPSTAWRSAPGLSLALAADFVLASPRAKFCAVFARLGYVPDMGAMYLLPRAIGLARAKDLVFSARVVDAEEALDLGLVQQVVHRRPAGRRRADFARALPAGAHRRHRPGQERDEPRLRVRAPRRLRAGSHGPGHVPRERLPPGGGAPLPGQGAAACTMARAPKPEPDLRHHELIIRPEQEYFAHLAQGRFMLQRSRSSGRFFFYPRVAEPVTGATRPRVGRGQRPRHRLRHHRGAAEAAAGRPTTSCWSIWRKGRA